MGKVQRKNSEKMVVYVRYYVCALLLITTNVISSEQLVSDLPQDKYSYNEPTISKLKPERVRGRGFKLEFTVDAPLGVFWNYKTNFDNDLLRKNKYITSHKLISYKDNLVITETEYSYKPRDVFNWQTTIYPDQNLLKYELLNPEECGQKYHYGYIQLEVDGKSTRVTHVAYFDFFGASFWVNYPFKGGMSDFLDYTARWEQQFVMEFERKYQ